MTAMTATAVPARRGIWQNRTLADGQTVEVQLMGDEALHFWEAADGSRYMTDDNGILQPATTADMTAGAARRRKVESIHKERRAIRRAATQGYRGEKRGLIILVEFRNRAFRSGHDKELYNSIANEPSFTSPDGFVGSVYDYFLEQSDGLFEMKFDVVGPVQLQHDYAYYGKDNGKEGLDTHPGEMVVEACRGVQQQVNFKDYDWDGDGEVDQVLVIYAGEGQADGGAADTVWPHEYVLKYSDYGRTLYLNNMRINTYACVNEITSSSFGNRIAGIGTLCHEFSHCLGLIDAYDANDENFGMGMWSPMASGVYNNNAFRPAGYTAYEKMSVGWLDPIELTTNTDVSGLKPLSEQGDAYYYVNDGNDNEYYMLEYREKTGWDASLPGRGLLITHIDYDDLVWMQNEVNTTKDTYSGNDHQRYTIFHADNSNGSMARDQSHDTYPYGKRDSLTNNSQPKATVYNPNKDGSRLMNKGVYNIRFEDGSAMAFDFRLANSQPSDSPGDEATLFYDSFNRCTGIGGNDNIFSGTTTIGSRPFLPDVTGWTYSSASGCSACARFGTRTEPGQATTPPFNLNGTALLTFKAAPWGGDATGLTVTIEGDATIEPSKQTMKANSWTEFSATIYGTGTVRLTFSAEGRMYLDEVLVTAVASDASIDATLTDNEKWRNGVNVNGDSKSTVIYDLQGRPVTQGNHTLGRRTLFKLQKGLYIVGGKKYVITNK